MKEGFIEKAGGVIYPLGVLGLYIVPAIWAYQIFHWLKWGRWRPIPLAEGLKWIGLREPRLAWGSAQKVLHWLLNLPLSLALGVFIIGVMLAYSEVADRTATSRRGGAN
jgi:hypothetical protein